jgi:hypothetical protein
MNEHAGQGYATSVTAEWDTNHKKPAFHPVKGVTQVESRTDVVGGKINLLQMRR